MNSVYSAYDRKSTVRQSGVRIKSAKRFVIFLVCVFLLITTVCALAFNNTYAEENGQAVEYVVDYGDSLWSIAQANKPEGINTRDYINMIVEFNGLNGSTIFPGEVIMLP